MAGMTQAEAVATLDARFPTSGSTDHVMWSENGSAESSNLGRMAIGDTGWAGATAAQPSVKSNANDLESPAATGACTITHYAIVSLSSGGTQRTDWTALGASQALGIGDKISVAAGVLDVTLD